MINIAKTTDDAEREAYAFTTACRYSIPNCKEERMLVSCGALRHGRVPVQRKRGLYA
jgi:hypothetical protein